MYAKQLLSSLVGGGADSNKIDIAYECAIAAATKYVNNKNITVEKEYPFPVARLAYYYYNSLDTINLQSLGQGSRSFSFLSDIPNDIKASLPRYCRGF